MKGRQETADILNLMRVGGRTTPEAAVAVLGTFFPRSAESPEKQLFLLRNLAKTEDEIDAPADPVRGLRPDPGG